MSAESAIALECGLMTDNKIIMRQIMTVPSMLSRRLGEHLLSEPMMLNDHYRTRSQSLSVIEIFG